MTAMVWTKAETIRYTTLDNKIIARGTLTGNGGTYTAGGNAVSAAVASSATPVTIGTYFGVTDPLAVYLYPNDGLVVPAGTMDLSTGKVPLYWTGAGTGAVLAEASGAGAFSNVINYEVIARNY